MVKIAISQPLSCSSNRLIIISESGTSIKLVSSQKGTTFGYSDFLRVNKVTHIVGEDISFADAKALIEQGYQPNWYKNTGEQYSEDALKLMSEQQDGVRREIDYLVQYINTNQPNN